MRKKFDHKPVPFYFINDKIDRDEAVRQIGLMADCGISGLILHARDGIAETGYGTEKFFSDVVFLAEAAAEKGLKVWLFDEDSYPSGNEGGIIAMEHPEFVAQELKIIKHVVERDGAVKRNLGRCKAIRAFAVHGDSVEDLTDCFGVERAQWFKKSCAYQYYPGAKPSEHIRSAAYFPERVFYAENLKKGTVLYLCVAERMYCANRFGSVVDNTDADCVNRFKKDVYEKYFSLFRHSEVRPEGIFTDEPSCGSFPVWSDKLEKYFLDRFGYSLTDNLYRLFDGKDEFSANLRADYWRTVSGAFQKHYLKNLKNACNRNGLALVGHFESEENSFYQILKGNNVYRNAWALDCPGFDSIVDQIGGKEHPELISGAKLVSSVSAQRGLRDTLCECFGVNPFNFGIEGMKKIAGWLFIVGASVLVVHGFYYGYAGLRKYDAGKSFFFQDPDFARFKEFSLFAERYGKRLGESQSTAKTLLVYPNFAFADFALSDREKFDCAEKKYLAAVNFLTDRHIEFDLADCEYLDEHLDGGKVKVGKKIYDSVVFVDVGSPAMKSVLEKLSRSASVVFEYRDGGIDLEKLKKHAADTPIESENLDAERVNTFRKKAAGGEYLFLYNNCAKAGTVLLPADKNAYVYDFETDGYLALESACGKVEIGLAGYGFAMVFLTDRKKRAGRYVLKKEADFAAAYERDPDWTYRPPIAVNRYISEYDLSIVFEGKQTVFEKVRWGTLKEHYGADVRKLVKEYPEAVYDDSEIVLKNYPVRAEFTAEFEDDRSQSLLFDKDTFRGEAELFLNGEKIDRTKAEKTRVYDVENYKLFVGDRLKKGKNILKIVFDEAEESDGILGELYLI